MDRGVLQARIAEGATLGDLAAEARVDRSTMRRRLRQHGLETKRMSILRQARAARKDGVQSIELECMVHGRIAHRIDVRGSYRCIKCNGERVVARRRRIKGLLVAEAGGACQLCGYDRCTRALSFHHLDPAIKEFGLAFRGVSRSIERARAEAAKCILICANCHMEVEAGLIEVDGKVAASVPG